MLTAAKSGQLAAGRRSAGVPRLPAARKRCIPCRAVAHPSAAEQAHDEEVVWDALRDAASGLLAERLGVTPDALPAAHEEKIWLAADADGPQLAGHMLALGVNTPGGDAAVLSVAVHIPGPDARTPVRAHWACVKQPGANWRAPPPGWHTVPDQSYDAGWGAWQTPMEMRQGGRDVQRALLQLPLAGPLRHDRAGVALVLKTSEERWLKQMRMEEGADGQDSLQLVDLFLPTSGLPTAPLPGADRGFGIPNRPTSSPSPGPSPPTPPSPPAYHDAPHTDESVVASGSPSPGRPQSSQQALDADALALQKFILEYGSASPTRPDLALPVSPAETAGRPCEWMIQDIANAEPGAQRSLMHRFNTAAELLGQIGPNRPESEREAALAAVAVWLRLSATRHLPWNRNYNVKPREISAAQDRLCAVATGLWSSCDVSARPLLQLLLRSVGRGGTGDMGQRVRDEILEVQQRNHAKGGMMEEWHQKLHNNTSPDDVEICEALLAYCHTLDVASYWQVLHAGGITRERLASFDRPVRSEPHFSDGQVPGLIRDLTAYLSTLRAVHCGTDLASATANVLGFSTHSMKGKAVSMSPVPNVATPELQQLIGAALRLQQAMSGAAARRSPSSSPAQPQQRSGVGASLDPVTWLLCSLRFMELLLAARHAIRPAVLGGDAACGGRHRDVLFLDFALEGAARAALEGGMDGLRAVAGSRSDEDNAAAGAVAVAASRASTPRPGAPGAGDAALQGLWAQLAGGRLCLTEAVASSVAVSLGADAARPLQTSLSVLLRTTSLVVESAALSSYPNDQLAWALKWLQSPSLSEPGPESGLKERALQALSVVERLNRELSTQSASLVSWLQPTAESLGGRLGLGRAATVQFSEEVVRGTAAAPLAQSTAILEPWLRWATGGGEWQVVSRGAADRAPAQGVARHVRTLVEVQHHTFPEPTVLFVDELEGHEDVPEGCVAVLSLQGRCPDMLSHSAVRARNMNVLLAACYSPRQAAGLTALAGRQVACTLTGQDVRVIAQ